MTPELTFPVLSQDSSIAVADRPETLRSCNAVALLKNRYYENLVIIDSGGNRYRIVDVKVVPPLSTLSRWSARILNSRLQVELEIESLGPGSLEDAKRIVSEWLDRAPDFWEASREITEWRRLIARANSAKELIAIFV